MTVQEKFRQYHKDNPEVWALFVRFAQELKAAGVTRYSSQGIFHRIRWETVLKSKGDFKVNNTFSPDYARKLMEEYPEFLGFFETRVLRAE